MSSPEKLKVASSALSDRGLNERRPLNEDAFLADSTRCIFAVADGVGGAEAGEVASQTAIEVLDEAFRHHDETTDVEDLMELAIQRANSSIHQMAQEHARFAMMATTIVALHIKNSVATIGHVGDSRLYVLTPAGQLLRETEDHSVVEEEVRAGRMTREQAAHHPSKNVISRALGAEDNVEVDMKTIDVENGTEFLLCSDGITRHVSDGEIRQLLIATDDLGEVCEELKKRCYELGAEDNLTVVVVRAGDRVLAETRFGDLEPTITPETEPATAGIDFQQTLVGAASDGHKLVPASRVAFPASAAEEAATVTQGQVMTSGERPLRINEPAAAGSAATRIFVLLIFLVGIAGAFYAGTRYKGPIPFLRASAQPQVTPLPVSAPVEDPVLKFEHARRNVDRGPNEWLTGEMQQELAKQGIQKPLDSNDPEFLYLYGRASLLSGNTEEAGRAFETSIAKADLDTSGASATIRKEATLGLAALTLKSDKDRQNALKRYDEMIARPAPTASP
ncbi:MAG TPA: PP2C family serine/threonine-protein phosphatase [Pyrinomonadaceae bacterium]